MGETVTGNTTMLLEEGLDTGPILLQQEIEIGAEQTAVDLFEILATRGAPLVVETLAGLAAGSLQPKPQDHTRASLAPMLTRDDGRMDFAAHTATELKNRWRGFQPWPGAFTVLDGKKMIVHGLEVAERAGLDVRIVAEPGQLFVDQNRIMICCARASWLELLELQLEGKKRMTAPEFLRGTHLVSGIRLG
jgi:methionyl-tRNA formyltransferase